ncbi:MAG: hypothetical protein QF546_06260, partial [Alphaproteobacteria bacterium]|nr:hypothetical protein [Alphaproteobacteria bacterium]
DIISHSMNGGSIEVVGEVRANGAQVRETGSAPGGNGMTMGRRLEAAANDSLRRCADALLGTGPE